MLKSGCKVWVLWSKLWTYLILLLLQSCWCMWARQAFATAKKNLLPAWVWWSLPLVSFHQELNCSRAAERAVASWIVGCEFGPGGTRLEYTCSLSPAASKLSIDSKRSAAVLETSCVWACTWTIYPGINFKGDTDKARLACGHLVSLRALFHALLIKMMAGNWLLLIHAAHHLLMLACFSNETWMMWSHR